MFQEQLRKDTYDRIKKRMKEYKYRFTFSNAMTLVSLTLLLFSAFPLIPALLLTYIGPSWGVLSWPLSVGLFLLMFLVFIHRSLKREIMVYDKT